MVGFVTVDEHSLLSVKRRLEEEEEEPYYSDEEEDEYDDDFIDDGDTTEDVSRHIRDIFGYDKRK